MKDFKQLQKTIRETETLIAHEFGRLAFQTGKPRIPAQDWNAMNMLTGKDVGEGIHILNAWLQGWDTENLKGDTP